MKKLLPLFILLVLAGAGCATSAPQTKKADGGVLKTADAGKTWVSASVVPTAKGIGTLTTANILTMVSDPQESSFLYAGTREDGFLYSDDGAASWHQPKNKELSTGLVPSVQVDPKNVCTVYVAKGSRLYKSVDCMRTFQNDAYIESRSNVTVVKIAVDWFNPSTVWMGLSNGDLQKSSDGGKTWSNALHMKDLITDILLNQTDSRMMLVSSATKGFMKSIDGGLTWTDVSEKKKTGTLITYDLVQSAKSDVVIAATKYGLLRSADFGTTWESIKLITAPGQVDIRTIGMDASNPGTLYYATAATFYRSTDSGATWQTGKLPSNRVPRAILVDPKQSSMLYVGVASDVK